MTAKPTYEELKERIRKLEETISRYEESDGKITPKDSLLDIVFEMSPFSMWISDNSGTVTHTNRTLRATIKLNNEDIVGKYNVFEDENLEIAGVMPKVRDVFENHEPARFNIFWKADLAGDVDFTGARSMHIDVSMYPIVDENDQLKNVVCQWVDISDFKRTESELKESENKWRSYIDNAPFGVFIANKDGVYKEINPAAADITGYSEQELLCKSIPDLLATESIEEGQKHFKQLKDEGHASGESSFIHKNGEKRYWNVSAVKLNEDNFIGFTEDITNRKKAELATQKSEQKYRYLIQTASDAIYLVSNDGRFSDVNSAACNMLNRSREEILNLDISGIDPNFSIEAFINFWKETPLSEPRVFETTHLHKDGSLVPVEVSGQKFQVGDDVFFFGIARNITDRKKSEAILKESESKFKSIFLHANAGIALGDVQGNLIDVNDEFAKIVGYSKKELMKMNFIDFTHPDDLDNETELVEKLRAGEISDYRITKRYITKNEKVRWVDIAVTCRRNSADEVDMFIGMVLDITERKNFEIALQESEIKYRVLFENAEDAIFVANPDSGFLIDANKKAEELTGYSRDELVGKHQTFIHPSEEAAFYEKEFQKSTKKEGTKFIEMSVRTRDDENIPVEINAGGTVQTANGKIHIGIFRNISDRKQAESALKESEERLKLALDSVSDAVWDWRVDTGEVYFSSRWYEMLGYEPYELPQDFETWRSLLHPDDLPDAESKVFSHLETAETFEIEFRMRTKDNHWRYILARGKAVEKDEKGKAVRMLGTHMDITERKKLEKHIQQAQKMESIGNLAGGIAHEFNNILSIIIGNNELIAEDLPEWSLTRESCEEIRLAGLRARDIVKHLLTFSRRDDSTKKPIDIGSVVKESLKLIRSITPTNIDISDKVSPDCFPIIGDATQINQILINLCNNAADALPVSGGRIDIELYNSEIDPQDKASTNGLVPGKYVKLIAKDNGSGISPKIRERIFDPYFTTKDVGRGSGIGLAVVHGIVENHGGSISFESSKDKGTIFTILIPAYEGTIEEESNKTGILSGNGEKILYVDDEPSIAKLGRRHLESLGYDAYSTTDPEEALEMIKAEPERFDLVISDMAMPNIPGDQLIVKILSINPKMPTMICSGYSSRMSETKASEMGIRAFVMKPLVKAELAKKIWEVLYSSN